jgi:radical SAM protein with 4Fe4S-binding SPASM domain
LKARDISGQAPGGKRIILKEVLPLDTPFVVQIFPVYACNFKCHYCILSTDYAKRGFISDKKVMNFCLYKKCIDDIAKFRHKIKVLRFVGIGEPLLHKNIAEMVKYAVLKDVANRVEIITNASLLTPKMADALISAGLCRLVVSLQGTTKEKYQKVCAANIDFKKFVGNLRYFFNHKGNAEIYLKIVDYALEDKTDKEKFYEIFGDICDTLAIEYIVSFHSSINYKNILKDKKRLVTQFGLPVSKFKVCPQSFFTLQINPDGKVVPCYSWDYPAIMGDCNNQSVCEIWNGAQFQHFRRTMLNGVKSAGPVCANCNIIKYRLFPEDRLDDDVQRLKKLYGQNECRG